MHSGRGKKLKLRAREARGPSSAPAQIELMVDQGSTRPEDILGTIMVGGAHGSMSPSGPAQGTGVFPHNPEAEEYNSTSLD